MSLHITTVNNIGADSLGNVNIISGTPYSLNLTTTGTYGAATYNSASTTLNIPTFSTLLFTPQSVPYAGPAGTLIEDNTGLAYTGNDLIVGHNNAGVYSGFIINGGRASLQASINGMLLNVGSGFITGTYDATKQYNFQNRGNSYLNMYSVVNSGGTSTAGPWTHHSDFFTLLNISTLKTTSSAPVTTGSTSMVITDVNGLLSFAPIPTGASTTALSLTTTGSSGAATYNATTTTLNIPNYITPQLRFGVEDTLASQNRTFTIPTGNNLNIRAGAGDAINDISSNFNITNNLATLNSASISSTTGFPVVNSEFKVSSGLIQARYGNSATSNLPLSVNNTLADANGNITISVGGSSTLIYTEITKVQADALIVANTIVPGVLYKITGVDNTLYNDGTTSGTAIFVTGLTTNTFSPDGIGMFYNPKYTNTGTNGIWTNIVTSTCSVPTVSILKSGEIITANNGAIATLLSGFSNNRIYYNITSGDWSTATSITGGTSGALANISATAIPIYTIGQKIAFGGYTWSNVNGNIGAATNILNLNTEWTKVVYNTTDYNLVYDIIVFDYTNNKIIKRTGSLNNIIQHEFSDLAYFNTSKSLLGTPISVFGWGNPRIHGNIINSGYLENVNSLGFYEHNELYGQSIMAGNIQSIESYFQKNTLHFKSEIRNNITLDNCYIYGNVLENISVINSNKMYYNAYIYYNIISDSSTITSNEGRKGSIYSNTLKNSCNINFNVANENTWGIIRNNLNMISSITGNALKIGYTQVVGSDRCFITSNVLFYAKIDTNTLISGPNLRTINICSNRLIGDKNQDNPLRECTIVSNTITSAGSTTYIRCCDLKVSQISNANITGASNDIYFANLEDYAWDFGGVASTEIVRSATMKAKSMEVIATKTFTGAIGNGAIGNFTLPSYKAQLGYFIEEVFVDVTGTLVAGTGAIINLGINIDGTQSGLNDTTGLVSTLNTNIITKVINSTFTKAIATRDIVAEVKGAIISSGVMTIRIKLAKLN